MENIKYIRKGNNMEIKKVVDNKEKYMKLLLEADPDENVVAHYIDDGEMYGMFDEDEIVCEVIVTKVDDDVCGLKNIATFEPYRGQGYASDIIKYVFDVYKSKYKRMIVGTTENMIPFYVLNGFTRYYKTVKNFFIDNYNEDIWDGDLQCIDMYYYSKEFTNNILDYDIITLNKEYREEVNRILIDEWESTDIIIRGKVIDGTKLDGFIAMKEDKIIGLITYMIDNKECEICSLNSFIENKGIGTKLINKVKMLAKANNCGKLKLITTNNNIRALEFYQKKGFEISNIYINSMEISRKLKPSIPLLDVNGVQIKDEIELQMNIS